MQFLQMRRLSQDEQLIRQRSFDSGEQPQIDAQPHQREEVHGFLGRNNVRVGEDAVGAANVVVNHFRFLFQKHGTGVFFVLDDLQKDFFQTLNNGGFRFAEGHLVGNLENVAQRFRSFALETPNRQAQFVYRFNYFVDL